MLKITNSIVYLFNNKVEYYLQNYKLIKISVAVKTIDTEWVLRV